MEHGKVFGIMCKNEIRYRITFIDIFGEKKYYMNGASSETEEWAKHEIELLEIDNLKYAKGRSNFKVEPVEIKNHINKTIN